MKAFENRVALVTGGARGLGRATALELAGRGATVAIADRKAEEAGQVIAAAEGLAGRVVAYPLDQAVPASVTDCVGKIVADLGRIDLLFANAGTGRFSPLIDMPKDAWDTVIQVNLNGTFYVCQEVAKRMAAQGEGGSMVLTASSGAKVIADQLGAYCASKAAVVMLVKHLASELGTYRIRCNAVMPGVVETGMTSYMLGHEDWQRMVTRQTPVGRWGQPEDVAKLVTFLLSDDASYINGAEIMIDGGSTLHGFPRWHALDYAKAGPPDWEELFAEYPYRE